MGICGGLSAVAVKKKYPVFIWLNSDHVDNDCIGGKWWMIIGGEDKLKSRQLRYILMTMFDVHLPIPLSTSTVSSFGM